MSLAWTVRQIEELIPDSKYSHDVIYEQMESERKKNPLLNRVITGEETLPDAFDRLEEKFGDVNNYIPHWLSAEDRQEAEQLEALVGRVYANRAATAVGNPITLGGGAAVLTMLFSRKKLTSELDRRRFAKIVGAAGLAASFGMAFSMVQDEAQGDARENAVYLQEKIDRLYT